MKNAFSRYNPTFRHVRWTDADEQNNFGARLAQLEEQARKRAAGE